jgi:hypothetical protein
MHRETYLLQTTLLPPVKQEITDNLILQRDTNVLLFKHCCRLSL